MSAWSDDRPGLSAAPEGCRRAPTPPKAPHPPLLPPPWQRLPGQHLESERDPAVPCLWGDPPQTPAVDPCAIPPWGRRERQRVARGLCGRANAQVVRTIRVGEHGNARAEVPQVSGGVGELGGELVPIKFGERAMLTAVAADRHPRSGERTQTVPRGDWFVVCPPCPPPDSCRRHKHLCVTQLRAASTEHVNAVSEAIVCRDDDPPVRPQPPLTGEVVKRSQRLGGNRAQPQHTEDP